MRKAQNGEDKAGGEQRRHRKGKEGSGGLPLYIFLQESVATGGSGRKVDPRCPNKSNPYHVCTDYCLTKMSETKRDDGPKSPFSLLSRHSRSSSSDGSSRGGTKVDPRCPNSSNPYHECTENCHLKFRQTDREDRTKSPFPLFSRSSPTSSDGSSRENRKVDPRCPNSTNPYHECSDNCQSKFNQTDREDKAKSPFHLFFRNSSTSSGGNSEYLGDNRKVDPRCVNASNPYHECGDHCLKKLEGNHAVPKSPDSSTSRKSKGNVQNVERREGVHPDCANASNPYHKCTNNCFEKMQR
ncbi:GCIP-interacting family protein [Rhynchospora pubera]|uniref:GCIP-interacting family protein n=1 Tax=Rhynchospora pubera TaxID=906938 RepID=A0AAV8EC62_9POAL|nr:GCIP-interacting family protein [Rhynchospora pubera]